MVDDPDEFYVMQISGNAEYGYFLEIDGYTLDDKHDQFNDYAIPFTTTTFPNE